MRGVGGDAGEGVVAVHEAPVVAGGAVVGVGPVGGGAGARVEVEPLALAAVEVPVVCSKSSMCVRRGVGVEVRGWGRDRLTVVPRERFMPFRHCLGDRGIA